MTPGTELRQLVRLARRRSGFTAAAIAILACAIASSVAMFSVVDAVLLSDLPFGQPDSLRWLWSLRPDSTRGPFSIDDYISLRERNGPLDDVAAFANWSANLTHETAPERLTGMRVSTNAFQVLKVGAQIGRTIAPADAGAARLVVIGHALWLRRFGGDASVIGRSMWLNGEPYAIVGVLPASFVFAIKDAQLAIPLDEDRARQVEGEVAFLRIIGRLKPGVTDIQATAELTGIARDLQRIRPIANARKPGIAVESVHDYFVGSYGATIELLFGAVILVVLLACANLGSLSAARAPARRTEMAVRAALGAGRGDLVRQVLFEHVALAIVAGGLGVALAYPLARALRAVAPPTLFSGELALNARVTVFAVGLTLVTGVLVGLAPALRREPSLLDALRGAGRGGGGRRQLAARRWVIAAEAAGSVVLLVATALFVRSLLRLEAVSTGFQPEHALAIRVALPRQRYTDVASVLAFQRNLDERFRALPGAASVGAVSLLPFGGLRASVDFIVEGRPLPRERVPEAEYRIATPHYFDAIGVKLVKGRLFSDRDSTAQPSVAVVNETLAARMWPGENPVGSHIHIEPGNTLDQLVEVVGVVGDVKQFALEAQPTMDLYVPFQQLPERNVVWVTNNQFWVVRSDGDVGALAPAARAALAAVDPDVPATEIVRVGELVDRSLAARRFNVWLLEAFGIAALVLTICGIYAVTSCAVAQRTRELGIRAALGASPFVLVRGVLLDDLRAVGAGIVAGLAVATQSAGALSRLLFGIEPGDPVAFLAVGAVLLLVATLACGAPASRAARIDPIRALKAD